MGPKKLASSGVSQTELKTPLELSLVILYQSMFLLLRFRFCEHFGHTTCFSMLIKTLKKTVEKQLDKKKKKKGNLPREEKG